MGIADREIAVRPFGSFGHQPLVGLIQNDPSIGFGGEQGLMVAGIPLGPQYIYGSFRSKETNKYFRSMRTFSGEIAGYFFLLQSQPGEDHQVIKESHNHYRGMIDLGEKDGMWGYWRPNERTPASFMSNTTEAIWREGDFINVSGRPIDHPMQFAIPDPKHPLVYTSRGFIVDDGIVNGERVSGVFCHDIMHLRPGQGWHHTKYIREIEGVWVVFITEFEDGTVHYGQLIWGLENFSLAIIQRSDGTPIIATNIDVEVELDKDGYSNLIKWHVLPGETWEWKTIGTRFPKTPIAGPAWSEGVVCRQGETRKWVKAEAYLDTIADVVRHKAPKVNAA